MPARGTYTVFYVAWERGERDCLFKVWICSPGLCSPNTPLGTGATVGNLKPMMSPSESTGYRQLDQTPERGDSVLSQTSHTDSGVKKRLDAARRRFRLTGGHGDDDELWLHRA
ncbi:unnamed protein product, partial [Pleuronectes platessa]